ncbi:MAG: UDP-N-acetylmuramate--L-alanine ligase [Christensenellales bacterium]
MQNLSNLLCYKKIYFIGIGGISLSAVAHIVKNLGFEVCGSDEKLSEITTKLEKSGIKVFEGHKEKNIKNFKPDLVVFSGAIHEDNKELKFAKKNGTVCLERAKFLGELLRTYQNVISVAGTHGKTTTTSMISEIFLKAGLNPTVHIGGESVNLDSNFFVGGNKYFITEACEYRKSFLNFKSNLGLVLNVEEDHPDCYQNLLDIQRAFFDFSKICDKVVVNKNFEQIFLAEKNKSKFITFGFEKAKFCAKNIRKLKNGGYSFSVTKNGEFFDRFRLNIFGKHNILNALGAICVCDFFEINKEIMKQALSEFSGVKRRFEKVETSKFLGQVFFDYAHHPTEIKKLITEVGSLNKPIICVFQPHTYSRTKQYFDDFLKCFDGAYQTIFFKTYKAREKKLAGASAKDLFKRLKQSKNVFYYNSFGGIIKHLKKYSKSNCVVLFVGAGDIYDIKKYL